MATTLRYFQFMVPEVKQQKQSDQTELLYCSLDHILINYDNSKYEDFILCSIFL